MPSRPFLPVDRPSRSGVALVIVLAFVLLLTGLVVAFFSRALSERQISNSSASQVKVDVLAQGAVNTVIGDFQQEIAAGSTSYALPAPTPAQGSATIFTPTTAATMVPAQALQPQASPAPTPTGAATGLENLVKQSAGGVAFYQGTGYSGNFPASKRAATSVSGTGATGDNNTSKPSLSGRYISTARWNKPLLMPATSATDPTPIITGGTYVPPDWVLVARDGSNPTTWSSALTTSPASTTAVTGRFAYNIYDEGGLLDANVAGYPAGAYPADTTAPAPTPLPTQPTRKASLAYADLTVPVTLPGGATQPLMTAKEINSLVGWRNNASAQSSGAFPNYTPAATPGNSPYLTPFDISTLFVPSGYLSVSNSKLNPNNNGSDRMFGSRQQLIDFLLQGVATTPAETASLQNSLQYLSTFSRSIEQPSFIPDPARPKVLPTTAGGNNAGGLNLEDVINPSFLTVRVKTASSPPTGGRFDGSDLKVGEPLVKKRFPLNRLAWLTYAGPITLDGRNYNPKLDANYVSTLKSTYYFTDAFLLQGTATNIQTCFGLSWNTNNNLTPHWTYSVSGHGGNGTAIYKLIRPPNPSPSDPPDVVDTNPGREPDFFELLKASINVGSIGKAATATNPTLPGGFSTPYTGPYQAQYLDDTSVDEAIIQIGANIIDQFDLDGYPTWINFNNGNSKDIYGVENLPYISGIKNALVKVKQASQAVTATTVGIKDTGVGALLQCPELWNPHDYNPNNLLQTAGVVGPTSFRIYATSGTTGVNSGITLWGLLRSGPGNGHRHPLANPTLSPGYQSQYGFSFGSPESRTLTQANTELDFSVTKDTTGITRFREPTILFQPPGSNGYLTASPTATVANFGNIATSTNLPLFFLGNAFKSNVDSGEGVPPIVGNGYVGFYLGAVPLYWADGQANNALVWLDNVATVSPFDVHYILQYQDATGNWVTYDEKDRTIGGGGSEGSTLSAGGDPSPANKAWGSFFYMRDIVGAWDTSLAVMDPRTSRFHLMKYTSGNNASTNNRYWTYPPFGADSAGTATRAATPTTVGFKNGWIDPAQGIILAQRSGTSDGASLMCPEGLFPSSMGWNPGSQYWSTSSAVFSAYNAAPGAGYGQVSGNFICRPGMFSQNNPFLRRNNRPMGDTGDSGTMDGIFGGAPVSNAAESYSDPDGVIRRATGGLVPYAGNASSGIPATTDVGLPMSVANTTGVTRVSQSDSRSMILNRPFRTVGELAYTFAGTPWKNLNFTMPESGDSALLDVFCVNDTDDANGLVAGKVNLNTRQVPVLQAIIAGAYKDEQNPGAAPMSTATLVQDVAKGLVTRTTGTAAGKGPLRNVSELVGRFVSKMDANTDTTVGGIATSNKSTTISPRSYDGFSADLINNLPPVPPATTAPPTGILYNHSDPNYSIPRFADATVRALAASGQTRVWNLLIDVIAQSGRYPQSATSLDKFSVEGEQRYWVHVAIDRLTGQVIDKQVEVVKE